MHPAPITTSLGAAPPQAEPVLLGAGVASAAIFSPSLLDVLLVANLAALIVLAVLQVAVASLSRARASLRLPRPRRWSREPFVSIHVPISNEPPHVVARTLDALSRLEWSAFEVIVLDNNTRDEESWRPIERLCARLGRRFRFHHVRRLKGAKAAALNLCLAQSDPRTELVLVVDADYRVHPKLLKRAARYFDEPLVSHVQFPQAYGRVPGADGLVGEYASYFDAFLPFGDLTQAPLLTGTLCLVQRSALEAAGGWSSRTLTEDAELGVRLLSHGFSGRYAPEVAGRGVLPGDLAALRAQRRRWVFGNAQTLFGLEPRTWRALGPKRALGVTAQLTAWFSFLLLPALALPLLAFVPKAAETHSLALVAAAAAFPIHLLAKALLFSITPDLLEERKGVMRSLGAHLGLLWESSTAWLTALFGVRLAFQRTNKVPCAGTMKDAAPALGVAALLGVSASGLLWRGHLGAALGCLTGALMFASVLLLKRELQSAGERARARRATSDESVTRVHEATRSPHGFHAHQRHDPDLRPRWHLPGEGDRQRPSTEPPDVQRNGR